MADIQHIYTSANPPSAPPSGVVHHYLDTTLKNIYFSKGTGAISDWVLMGEVVSVNGAKGVLTLNSGNLAFTPNGDISANTIQNAIVEVRDDADVKVANAISQADIDSIVNSYIFG